MIDAGTPTAPPVTAAATGTLTVLLAAELRGLPMPFAAKAYDYLASVELQFHTAAEVHTWAAALDVDTVDEKRGADGFDHIAAHTTWYGVPLTLVASVPREPRGEGVAS